MKELFKGKLGTILILLATVILAGVAIYTAIRLYQLRQEPVAPNVPSSIPKAAEFCGGIAGTACTGGLVCIYSNGSTIATHPDESGTCGTAPAGPPAKTVCSLSFTVAGTPTPTGTPTGTPTSTPTGTPNETPTPTPTGTPPTGTPNSCNGTCGSNANCSDGLMCYQGFCRNPSCAVNTNCTCAGTPGPTSTPVPTLPKSGTDWPTIAGFGIGMFVILGSILLAL